MFFVLEFEISLAALLEIPSICKLSQKSTTPLISVTLFLLEGSFFPVDLLTHFLNEAEEMVALQTFSESVHISAELAMWVSLWLDYLSFLRGSSLEPKLSSWMEEKRNRIPCSKDVGMHPLLYYRGLVSKQCIVEVSGRAWMQRDPEFVVPCIFQSLEKLKHLVSIVSCPWSIVTSSLHVHSKYWEDTLQTVQFISWEGNFRLTC